MFRLAAVALIAGSLAHTPGSAQEKTAKVSPETAMKRNVLTLLHADPDVTAEILAQHFEGLARVSTLPDGLLVSASPAVVEEMTKLVARLDRKPQSVEVEVALVDVRKGIDGKEPDVSDAAKIDALVKAGQATVQRIKVTAIEGRPVISSTGGDKPYSTAMTVAGGLAGGGRGGHGGAVEPGPGGFGGGGPVMQRSVNYRTVGMSIKLTARVGAEDAVALALNVQETRIRQPEGVEEANAVGGVPSFENGTLTTHMTVPAGKAVTAQAIRTDGKSGGSVSLVIVTAKVIDSRKPAN